MKIHPFERTPSNCYGFEVGQEVEWFEWLFKYREALMKYRSSLENDRYHCEKTLQEYISIKEEWRHICYIINYYIPTINYRPFHSAFIKSQKVDAIDRVKLKNKLLKLYEEGEFKDGKYYLSIVNAKP